MSHRTLWAGVAIATSTFATPALGGLIPGFGLEPSPDITTGFVDVYYDASSSAFVAEDSALTYDDGGGAEAIIGGAFTINAVVDNFGTASSGSLLIEGTIPSGPFGDPLLTGTLTAFGWVGGGGDIFQFIFSVSGGSLAAAYGGLGAEVGVLLDANIPGGYTGDWTLDFDNRVNGQSGTGNGVANAAPVPAPGVLSILCVAMMTGRRRRNASH
jgi:hypothetical protein